MTAREVVDYFRRESQAALALADDYNYDNELYTQYFSEARTWRIAANFIERELLCEDSS